MINAGPTRQASMPIVLANTTTMSLELRILHYWNAVVDSVLLSQRDLAREPLELFGLPSLLNASLFRISYHILNFSKSKSISADSEGARPTLVCC